mmetsp:Transcript_111187/g.248265  ORF Transcript_111187/g.248265 Transcript_111187/m.248265 type:complete len:232 (+) Transcript_111187:1397-2092(+)
MSPCHDCALQHHFLSFHPGEHGIREPRRGEDGLDKRSSTQVCRIHERLSQLCPLERGTQETGAAKVCTREVNAAQVGALQIRTFPFGACTKCLLEGSPCQPSPCETCCAQASSVEPGSGEVGFLQDHTAEVGFPQVRLCEDGAGEGGAHKLDPPHPCTSCLEMLQHSATEVSTLQVRTLEVPSAGGTGARQDHALECGTLEGDEAAATEICKVTVSAHGSPQADLPPSPFR